MRRAPPPLLARQAHSRQAGKQLPCLMSMSDECCLWRAAGYEEHVPITAEEVEERKQKVEEERKARRKKGGKKKHRKGDEL